MKRASIVRVLVFAAALPCWSLRTALAARLGQRSEDEQHLFADGLGAETVEHDVHILLTRHGLSCTNIVEKWVSWYDFGRAGIADPLLGGAGTFGSYEAAKDVKNWLEKGNHTIDGVLTSVLGRAMETALLMYPAESTPLYVVPFIREHASGLSNAPKTAKQQVEDLTGSIADKFQMNYEWIESHGSEKGTWEDFVHFLQESFLPKFIETHQIAPGRPIVLAAVSHSKYIRASPAKKKCEHFWLNAGAKKPLNNQVLRLPYRYREVSPPLDSLDSTPMRTLQELDDECEEVAHGLTLKDSSGKYREPLCLNDVGDTCIDPIQRHANWPGTLWDKTVEHQIISAAQSIDGQHRSLERIEKQVKRFQQILDDLDNGRPISVYQADDDRTYYADLLKSKLRAQSDLSAKIKSAKERLQELKRYECWTGGFPRTADLAKTRGITLKGRVKELALSE